MPVKTAGEKVTSPIARERVGPRYVEIECRSALNRVDGMPFRWTLNPYRGCVHGCHYCFARRTHTFLELDAGTDFSNVIFVKVNVARVLREELSRRTWRREMVALGTATDPYQPVEGRYRLTRAVLEALRDFRTPVSIVTKGPMVVRDLDLLRELDLCASVTVCISVPTVDVGVWRRMEPGTAPPRQRLAALRRLVAGGINAGVLLAPILPGVTTERGCLEAVVAAAAEHGARFLRANVLHLEMGVKEHYLSFLARAYPELLPRYRALYPRTYAPRRYQERLQGEVAALKARFGLAQRDAARPAAVAAPVQLALPLGGIEAGERATETVLAAASGECR